MRILFVAPHRLAFLTGSVNLLALALWWLWQLASLHFGAPALPQGNIPAALLHGPAMLFLIFPPFAFGFLLTVFPRWMGFPDLNARDFGPVSGLLAAGSAIFQAGIWLGNGGTLLAGFGMLAFGWLVGMQRLARVLAANRADDRPLCWHGWSAFAALAFGLAGLLLEIVFLVTLDSRAWQAGNRLGLSGFVLPLFLTVAHRMVPFFTASVVTDYVPWRPYWLLGAMWPLLLAQVIGKLGHLDLLASSACAVLSLLTGLTLWKWWPRAKTPGLLVVLFLSFAWAPAGFAMDAALALGLPLGRAPDHALFLGFAGSLIVSMVTRVTQGHSGRALEMPLVAWLAFWAMQLTAALRIAAALMNELALPLVLASALFAFGLAPWVIRHTKIYASPRSDGKPG
jgi:uncharacterized protein involved in response to NO